jgi:hypothetical protein
MNAVKYRDDIRDPIVLPFLQQRNFERVFQHGNARCHVALSPDLSPIEYIWDEHVCDNLLQQRQLRISDA